VKLLLFITSPTAGLRNFATSVSVCLSVCLLVSQNRTYKFHEIFCARYLWPWLGPPPTTVQCVMYVCSRE